MTRGSLVISRKTWHYKLMTWWTKKTNTFTPNNLCEYVQTLFIVMLVTFLVLLAGTVGTGVNVWMLFTSDADLATILDSFGSVTRAVLFIIPSILNIILMGVLGIWGFGKLIERLIDKRAVQRRAYIATLPTDNWGDPIFPIKAKKPSIFVEWWKAKLDKMCPFVSFED